ncbi:hypothetical protein [Ilumatobacter sp.]|uniref:hypothetical protein n=1 Tax=Ilumatobacter sp. TaxID=1967498 RepID=UPI003AF5C91C
MENLSRQNGLVVSSSGTSPTVAELDCPAGQYVISGGYAITSVVGQVPEILSSLPIDADTWQVVANGTIDSYDLQAIALCAILPGQV